MACHGQRPGGSEAGAPCSLGEDAGRAHSMCKGPGGGMCWPPAHKGGGQLGASVAREGVSRRGRDPRGRRGGHAGPGGLLPPA